MPLASLQGSLEKPWEGRLFCRPEHGGSERHRSWLGTGEPQHHYQGGHQVWGR